MSQQTTASTPDVRSILDRARTGHEDALPDDERDELVDEIDRDLYAGATPTRCIRRRSRP